VHIWLFSCTLLAQLLFPSFVNDNFGFCIYTKGKQS
jgi:hypothetical protein